MISLKALRTNSGLTLEKAAQKIGVSKYTLYNYEHFKTQPSKEKIDKKTLEAKKLKRQVAHLATGSMPWAC